MNPFQAEFVRILRESMGALGNLEFPEVWGPRIVVRAETPEGVVYAKAAGDADVRGEVAAIRLAAEAGLPVPHVLRLAADARVPGGYWFAMSEMPGIGWAAENEALADQTLPGVASCLARLHRVTPAGFGPLDQTGQGGCDSWVGWVTQTARDYLDGLVDDGDVTAEFRTQALNVFEQSTPSIERGSLIHGDLTGSETLVDPLDGKVIGIVDWGNSLVGDPIYDFGKLQAGGPADDPTPRLVLPTILQHYLTETGMDRERIDRTLPLYQAHNALFNADWCRREKVPWIDGLVTAASTWLRLA